jgi:3,5-epimerase/4-reductase
MAAATEAEADKIEEKQDRKQKQKFLVFGAHGWIGGQVLELMQNENENKNVIAAPRAVRLEYRHQLEELLEKEKPTHVVSTAGITGTPNIDWCEAEGHKQDTLRANVIGALNLADVCYQRNIHHTILYTGCTFLCL